MADSPPRLIVNVAELLRRPGSRRDVDIDVALTGAALTDARASRAAGPIELQSLSDQIAATGTLIVDWTGSCRRCLGPVVDQMETSISEIFERQPTEGETSLLDREQVDLGSVVHEAVLLDLPLAPLCSTSCVGPDPERFPAAPAPDDDDASPPTDPRWAALSEITFDD